MRRAIVAAAFALLGTAGCRQGDPSEPRTPPNSPIPEIDRPKDTGGGDAGAAVPSGAPPRATH